MDLKQEIKLSDLFGRKGGGDEGVARPRASRRRRSRPRAAARRSSSGSSSARRRSRPPTSRTTARRGCHKLHREPLPAGIMSGGEVRDPVALGAALASFFEKYDLPQEERAARARQHPRRRAPDRDRRCRGRRPARERDRVPRERAAVDPDRRSGHGLSRRRRGARRGRNAEPLGGRRDRLSRIPRPLPDRNRRSRPRGRRQSTSRHSHCSAP